MYSYCINVLKAVEVEVILRPTVSRPVCPGVGHPSGTSGKFFFVLEMFFRQLRVCYFVAPFLTRGPVCNLLLLLVSPAQSRRTQDHILLSQFLRLPQPGGPGPRIYIPQKQGGSDIPLGTHRAMVVFYPASIRDTKNSCHAVHFIYIYIYIYIY
jgi:hypothetical protein